MVRLRQDPSTMDVFFSGAVAERLTRNTKHEPLLYILLLAMAVSPYEEPSREIEGEIYEAAPEDYSITGEKSTEEARKNTLAWLMRCPTLYALVCRHIDEAALRSVMRWEARKNRHLRAFIRQNSVRRRM